MSGLSDLLSRRLSRFGLRERRLSRSRSRSLRPRLRDLLDLPIPLDSHVSKEEKKEKQKRKTKFVQFFDVEESGPTDLAFNLSSHRHSQ
jgi:hypothetical protein